MIPKEVFIKIKADTTEFEAAMKRIQNVMKTVQNPDERTWIEKHSNFVIFACGVWIYMVGFAAGSWLR